MPYVYVERDGYAARMPNKTIYVADDDLPLLQRAQQLVGGNLSAAIMVALRRYVEAEEGKAAGYEEVVVKVGTHGATRKQRFVGVLLAEWGRQSDMRVEVYRIYRTPRDRYVLWLDRSPEWKTGYESGNWVRDLFNPRIMLGIGEQTWGFVQGETILEVADDLDALRPKIPADLYEVVAEAAAHPAVEDLDI
jgi:EXLDI family protein